MNKIFKRISPFVETAFQAMARDTDLLNINEDISRQIDKVDAVYDASLDWYFSLSGGEDFECWKELEKLQELLDELNQLRIVFCAKYLKEFE